MQILPRGTTHGIRPDLPKMASSARPLLAHRPASSFKTWSRHARYARPRPAFRPRHPKMNAPRLRNGAAAVAGDENGSLRLSYGDTRSKSEAKERLGGGSSVSESDGDTIAAIVTAVGGAVGIVRLSGSLAVTIASHVFVPMKKMPRNGRLVKSRIPWKPISHRVEYGALVDGSHSMVDEVLMVPMLAPKSYTREDVVEFQCHGGIVCLHRVLQICLEAGARLARPGEFTLRAFLNGRLDLMQAESVSRLISAKTVAAADVALSGLQGGLSSFIQDIRSECIEMLAEMEARLDFDEELPNLDASMLVEKIDTLWHRLQHALETEKRGKLLESGIQVAIVGRPNVGKSSLLNAWSQSEKAIVTDVAGTTRDVIEAGIVVGGFPIRLLDTAGIQETTDVVEMIGMGRSEAAAGNSDIIIMVISAQDGWTEGDTSIYERLWRKSVDKEMPSSGTVPSLMVINKIDQASPGSLLLPEDIKTSFSRLVHTCAIHNIGLLELEKALLDVIDIGKMSSDGSQWAINQRQAEQLLQASQAFQRLKNSIQQELPIDFWTIDMNEAVIALGQISGDEVSDEVLSRIFSKFCIGK